MVIAKNSNSKQSSPSLLFTSPWFLTWDYSPLKQFSLTGKSFCVDWWNLSPHRFCSLQSPHTLRCIRNNKYSMLCIWDLSYVDWKIFSVLSWFKSSLQIIFALSTKRTGSKNYISNSSLQFSFLNLSVKNSSGFNFSQGLKFLWKKFQIFI